MSGAETRGLSRGALIRQRAKARFVGRRAQLTLFTENLAKDPFSEEAPADFLFHVRGVGGVGKSTLLRQWQEAARRADAITAVVDENDVHGVQQALVELIRQLEAQGGPCKEFGKAVEQFRREQAAQAEPLPVDGEASVSSRVLTQAALGATSLIPGAGFVTAMANPEAAAQGLDRLRSQSRSRSQRRGDETGLSRAFVAELERLCRRQRWVVLFFDTWEQTAHYLDGWLLRLLDEEFGPVPANVVIVLAGRDELAERDWAPLRAHVVDVPLEVFTEAEAGALLTSRGVTEPAVVEAVLQLSMGLPLLVELLSLARPSTVEDLDAGGDFADVAVERFVQWITDPMKREAVRACALPLQLNEDVFSAAVGPEAEGLWEWLCRQPFVSGRGDHKHYHAVVRASMVHQQRTHSPQGWASAHTRLADAHDAWAGSIEERLPEAKRWQEAEWRRHRREGTYHRLCAHPRTYLTAALEQLVHAAGWSVAVLRQWIEAFEQAAHDTTDTTLLAWAGRLRSALTSDDPALGCLGVLLSHVGLSPDIRSWAFTYRGNHLYLCNREEEALAELNRAIAQNARNATAWSRRGEVHRWFGHNDQAMADLTTALAFDPTHTWTLTLRGHAHQQAGRYDQAVADLTAALELDPTSAWTLGTRGHTHQQAGRYDQAIADLTAAIEHDPTLAWARSQLGEAHWQAGHHDRAIAVYTAALEHDPTYAWALAGRGEAHQSAGRYEQAIADLTAALELDPTSTWTLASRGHTHHQAGRYDQAIADLTAAIELDPTSAWALGVRGEAHRETGDYDRAVADLTAALELDPTSRWILGARGHAHHQAGRYDQAVADLTASLEHDPTYLWALTTRVQVHRQAGQREEARRDLERAAEGHPEDASWMFEKLMFEAVDGRLQSSAEQWSQLFSSLVNPTDAEIIFLNLFRSLFTERQNRVPQATEEMLAAQRGRGYLADLLSYLVELSALPDELGNRARQCRDLIMEHDPDVGRP
ncbi:tetratricopeptide repeat protein [Streptomyces rubiginosohelvolus]|uniref:tetratricopeptide repeat protein n=1 Tax=Streptomyces rubiginosohelvolus TaxID=67362 RepID=UPI0033A64631